MSRNRFAYFFCSFLLQSDAFNRTNTLLHEQWMFFIFAIEGKKKRKETKIFSYFLHQPERIHEIMNFYLKNIQHWSRHVLGRMASCNFVYREQARDQHHSTSVPCTSVLGWLHKQASKQLFNIKYK